jgi:hypothetical protein
VKANLGDLVNSQTAHGIRRRRSLVVLFLALAVVAVIGIAAQQALAYNTYWHGTMDPTNCGECHLNGHTWDPPVNEVCNTCHPGYAVPSASTMCWTCHNPGQDMTSASTAAACTQACHLQNAPTASVAGTPHDPHPDRGVCTTAGCHNVSTSPTTANGSPHHTAQATTPTPTPTPPAVTNFTPASGRVGTFVTLTGTGFTGAKVAFNGITAAIFTVVSATKITATVPSGATSGTIVVTTPGGTGTSATSFTVITAPAKPKIIKLSPTSGKRSVTVTITGTAFGAKRGTSYVKFGVTKCSKYLSWSKTRIKCRVPAKAKFGWLKVRVTTTVGTSIAKSFRVKR